MTLPMKFEKIDNLLLLRNKANLLILINMQTGFLELSLLLLIFVDCKSITEPFLYQKGANNCS